MIFPFWRRKQVFPFSTTFKTSGFSSTKAAVSLRGDDFYTECFLRWRRRRVFPHLFVCFAQRPLCGGMVCGLRHSLGLGLQQANRKYANISKYPNARSIDYRGLRTTTSVLPDFILCAFGTGSGVTHAKVTRCH